MQAATEPYPLRRSFLEERFGTAAAGLVQFNSKDLVDRVSASTLAGAVISAADAPIGTLEFDALTVLSLRFGDSGDKATNSVTCSLGSLLSMLGITLGTWQRRDLAIALKRLYDVSLELPEYDDDGNEIGVRARRLFTELAIFADSAVLRGLGASPRARTTQLTTVGEEALRGSRFVQIAEADNARVEITLAPWFAEAVLERSGKVLDLETQRALDGVAKRVWVALNMLAYVQHETLDIETHTREVDDRFLGMLRLKAKRPTDNRKTLTKALSKVLARDPTYQRAEIVRRGSRYMLEIERSTGPVRQELLRDRQRTRESTAAS
ncbi:MAG: hypothetical protein ACLGHP_09805 [Vicinamibacteria bacterium]